MCSSMMVLRTFLTSWLSGARQPTTALEPLDAAAARRRPGDTGVCLVTVGADVDDEIAARRADGERVAARRAAHRRGRQLRMDRFQVNRLLQWVRGAQPPRASTAAHLSTVEGGNK